MPERLNIRNQAREGVIIESPLNGLFHDARDIILTSRNDGREMEDNNNDNDNDNDNEPTLVGILRILKTLLVDKIMTSIIIQQLFNII